MPLLDLEKTTAGPDAGAAAEDPPGLVGSRVWCPVIRDELAVTAMTEQGLLASAVNARQSADR